MFGEDNVASSSFTSGKEFRKLCEPELQPCLAAAALAEQGKEWYFTHSFLKETNSTFGNCLETATVKGRNLEDRYSKYRGFSKHRKNLSLPAEGRACYRVPVSTRGTRTWNDKFDPLKFIIEFVWIWSEVIWYHM